MLNFWGWERNNNWISIRNYCLNFIQRGYLTWQQKLLCWRLWNIKFHIIYFFNYRIIISRTISCLQIFYLKNQGCTNFLSLQCIPFSMSCDERCGFHITSKIYFFFGSSCQESGPRSRKPQPSAIKNTWDTLGWHRKWVILYIRHKFLPHKGSLNFHMSIVLPWHYKIWQWPHKAMDNLLSNDALQKC